MKEEGTFKLNADANPKGNMLILTILPLTPSFF